MISQQGPGVNVQAPVFNETLKSGKEIITILIRSEDRPLLDTSSDDVMQGTWCV
jgi:hypothetical protein